MTIRQLLAQYARHEARARAARLGARVALLGTVGIAILLLVARLGIGSSLIWLPALADVPRFWDRFLGFFFISVAGLLQGAVLLAVVLVFSVVVRGAGIRLLRRRPARVAAELDRCLATDRHSAALQADGPLAALVERQVLDEPAPAAVLSPRRPSRGQRWLQRGAVALVLLVALSPGTAPGGEGDAPVAGEPEDGRDERGIVVKLLGEKKTFRLGEPVPVQVVVEAVDAPEQDLDLPVSVEIDGRAAAVTGRRLFVAAGAPGQDATRFDLRRFVSALAPGKHRAVAYAGGVESNEYLFEIGEGDGGGGGAKKPQPQPQPDKKPAPGDKGGGAQPEWEKKFVEPLVQDGRKVEKMARIPIEVPDGGAQTEKSLKDAWPELQRRKEAALNRPGLSPHARKLVREYFDRLRPEGEK